MYLIKEGDIRMIKNKIIRKLIFFTCLLASTQVQVWAGGIGYDSNPSSMAGTLVVYNTTTPKIVVERSPYGGGLCELTSGTSVANGYRTASAKWRNPNIAGTITNGGYTYEIQRTNIPGIGVIARMEATFVENQLDTAKVPISQLYQTITSSVNAGAASVHFGRKYWALVLIPGEPIVPGSYSLGQSETMVDVWCQANDASNDAHGGGYLTGVVEIKVPTCALGADVSSPITMDLGQHQWAEINSLSVGSNFGSVSKSVTLECQAGTWPKLTVSDKNNNNNHSMIVGLTDPSAETTAQGVGVQIFLNNQSTPQQLATKVNLVSDRLTKDITISLPLQFKYVKTSETVSPGEANAIIDMSFEYN